MLNVRYLTGRANPIALVQATPAAPGSEKPRSSLPALQSLELPAEDAHHRLIGAGPMRNMTRSSYRQRLWITLRLGSHVLYNSWPYTGVG